MNISVPRSTLNKLATHPLQTWEWAEFRREWGNKVLTTKSGVITIHHIPFTKYKVGTFIRGTKPTKEMLIGLKDIAKKENLIFIKLELNVITSKTTVNRHPELDSGSKKIPDLFEPEPQSRRQIQNDSKQLVKLLKSHNAVQGKTLFTPTTFQIDLTLSEKDLMSNFSSKTRYNIRYADRQGVVVKEDNSDKAFEKYLQLMRETVERQKFYAHSEKYHRLMWKHLHTDMVSKKKTARNASSIPTSNALHTNAGRANAGGPIARLLTATYKKEVITAWIVFVWKDMMYYPYGASTERYKNVQANSAMMWNAILYGKKNKLKTFDLWGREEGKGFTKFKEGFSPNVVEFLGTWDLVTSNLYKPYVLLDRLRWKALRLRSQFSNPSF